MNAAHQRFTTTRDMSGFAGSTIHLAKPRRFDGRRLSNECNTAGVPAATASPVFR